jgi:hypothetical protein
MYVLAANNRETSKLPADDNIVPQLMSHQKIASHCSINVERKY